MKKEKRKGRGGERPLFVEELFLSVGFGTKKTTNKSRKFDKYRKLRIICIICNMYVWLGRVTITMPHILPLMIYRPPLLATVSFPPFPDQFPLPFTIPSLPNQSSPIPFLSVPPQTPQITAQPAEPVREGEFVSMRCESQGGNPAPHFHWLFDNRTRVPESWYHERHEGGPRGRTVSTLQWHLGRTDNGAYLTCQTWNRALREGEPMSAETNRLNVSDR